MKYGGNGRNRRGLSSRLVIRLVTVVLPLDVVSRLFCHVVVVAKGIQYTLDSLVYIT